MVIQNFGMLYLQVHISEEKYLPFDMTQKGQDHLVLVSTEL